MASKVAFSLHCHPSTTCKSLTRIDVRLSVLPGIGMRLAYVLHGSIASLTLPASSSGFADGLWRHTCFEMFLGVHGDAHYREFNFSPSGQWACYDFRAYREGMASQSALVPPQLEHNLAEDRFEFVVDMPVGLLSGACPGVYDEIGITAIVEEMDGSMSYWALSHPRAQPDFHDRAGFVRCTLFDFSKI